MRDIQSQLISEINGNGSESDELLIHIRSLLNEATRMGEKRRHAKYDIAEVLADPDLQRRLARWTRIEDREELRTRLELIRYFPEMVPELDDFILFFFRASDPVIYQTAAQTLGVQMRRTPRLKEWFLSYLKRQSISLNEPVRFNGERSRRRVSIALAAWYAEGAASNSLIEDEQELPLPLEPNVESYKDRLESPDLNACLISLRILLEGKTGLYSWETDALLLIHELAGRQIQSRERYLVRSASLLLAILDNVEPGQISHLWSELLDQILASLQPITGKSFTTILQRLTQIDELLHQTPKFKGAIAEDILNKLDQLKSSDTRLFLLLRMAIWHKRMNKGKLSPELYYRFQAIESDSTIMVPVRSYLVSTEGPSFDSMLDTSRALLLFFLLSRRMEDSSEWMSRLPSERAVTTLTLIDLVAFELEHHEEVTKRLTLLEKNLIQRDIIHTEASDHTATVRLLILAHRLEAETSLPADSNLIHQIKDPDLLLSLVPEDKETELLATLADAFEHQLRLGLLRDPKLSVTLYLYRISARKPHPYLFEQFIRTCKGRSYTRNNRQEVPLQAILERFLRESRTSQEEIRTTDHWNPPADDESGDPTEVMYLEQLLEFRNRWSTLYHKEDLFDSLKEFANLLEPLQHQQDSFSDTSDHWINRLVTESGKPDLSINNRYAGWLNRYRTLLPRLLPENRLSDHTLVKETLFELKKIVLSIQEDLSGHLSSLDRNLMTLATHDLIRHMDQWEKVIDHLNELEAEKEPGKAIGLNRWNEFFRTVHQLQSPPMRLHLIRLLFRSLYHRVLDIQGKGDAWTIRHTFVKAASLAPYKKELTEQEASIWEEEIANAWQGLLDQAIADQYETRVELLMQEDVFYPIYHLPTVQSRIYETRSWFYDRYNYTLSRKLSAQDRPGFLNLKRDVLTLRSYLLHFTNIWIALVIGAILMLDFGDAWVALAEIGDVGGVVLTFLVGTLAAGSYLYIDLRGKTAMAPEDVHWERALSRWYRTGQFLLMSLIFTLVITSLLWLLFSSTEEVVHGAGAVLHIVGWTGFALLIGIFFGVLSQSAT